MTKRKQGYYKHYNSPVLARIFLMVINILVFTFSFAWMSLIFGLMMGFTNSIFHFAVYLFLLYLYVSYIWYTIEVISTSIVINSKGLWLHSFGKRFYTWESLVLFGSTRTSINRWVRGIHTNEAQFVQSSRMGRWLWWRRQPIDNFIPLEWLSRLPRKRLFFVHKEKFKQTELGQDLLYYAPHLFDEKPKRKNQLDDGYNEYNHTAWSTSMKHKVNQNEQT